MAKLGLLLALKSLSLALLTILSHEINWFLEKAQRDLSIESTKLYRATVSRKILLTP